MTAQLADNAFAQAANARFKAGAQVLRRVPLDVWRKALIVFALFWLVHSAAKLFWVLYPVPVLPQPTTIAQPLVDEGAGGSSGVDLQLLQALNLGGTEEAPAVSEEVVEESVVTGEDFEETKLNLKLQGVVASSDENKGKAIIADGSKQALYQVGEKLPQGRNVKLAKVMADRVILDNSGKFEALYLYNEDDFKGSTNVVRASGPVNVPRPREMDVSKAPDEDDDKEDEDEPVSGSISRDKLKAKSINEVVRFSLHQENGQVMGYRIRPGRDRETFEQLGLQNNDIVTTVNGIAVTDRSQLREMYRTMRTATEAQLEVNRDGSIIPISITLDSSE